MKKKFYITTAIEYVNAIPHIGHAFEKIGADVIARFRRMDGYDVLFLMGNDEHSLNVLKASQKQNLVPATYCDIMASKFKNTWKKLNISYDDFVRTTEDRHERAVKKLFTKIYEKGDIYKDTYKGLYCESCEAFLTDKDLEDGKCPAHQTKPKWIEETNYFFALSKYRDILLKHIEENPEFILPEIRRNEIVQLLKKSADNISISRSSIDWGVTLPIDTTQVIYVWFDALINYISAPGYADESEKFLKYWPADMHIIGKDITRFHCVIWPSMLISAGVDLPKTIFGHGFVSMQGSKMSKSIGNVLSPLSVTDKFGADPLRFFILRQGGFGRDSDFVWENFFARYNNELANELGNLLNRTLSLIAQYFKGTVPEPDKEEKGMDQELKKISLEALTKIRQHLDHLTGDIDFHLALEEIWNIVQAGNKYVEVNAPWSLKKCGNLDRLKTVLYNLIEILQRIAILINPFMPETSKEMWIRLGLEHKIIHEQLNFAKYENWGLYPHGTIVDAGKPLFPKISEEEIYNLLNEDAIKKRESIDKEIPLSKKMEEKKMNLIKFDEFKKVEMRTAKVISAEKVEGTEKLMKMKISLGTEERQIVAGIAHQYKPEDIIDMDIIVVVNLEPVKIKGVESNGMLLAVQDGKDVTLLTTKGKVAPGIKVT